MTELGLRRTDVHHLSSVEAPKPLKVKGGFGLIEMNPIRISGSVLSNPQEEFTQNPLKKVVRLSHQT
jgi:hypothetical protein